MPLYFKSTLISDDINSLRLKSLKKEFQESSLYLFDNEIKNFNSSNNVLYVAQQEYATVLPSDDNVSVMGSEDATTCHILIIRHTGCGATALAHLDTNGVAGIIKKMLELVDNYARNSQTQGSFQVHIVGGFDDDQGISERLSLKILRQLTKSTSDLHLVTACLGRVNDLVDENGEHRPRIYGVGINMQDGVVTRASFADKGPDEILRSVRTSFGVKHGGVHVYDSTIGKFCIPVFLFGEYSKNTILYFLQLTDQELLETTSTSPRAEPSWFVTLMRRSFIFMLDNPTTETVFPFRRPRQYRRNVEDGKWISVSLH